MEQFLLLLSYMLIFSTSLSFVALGGMFSERSGIINIGLEGIMVVGGFSGLMVLNAMQKSAIHPFFIIIITILVAVVAGILYSLLLALVAIEFKADQTLAGTALNLLATAIAVIFTKRLNGGASTTIQYVKDAFVYSFGAFSINIFLFIAIVVIAVSFIVLYKFRFGLRLRACGENPSAADSVGINVKFYRYMGVMISGALGGLGALAYILPTQSFWNSASGVSGFGFLALAIMIFGQWKPLRISIISIVFSFFLSLSYVYSGVFEVILGYPLTADMGITSELFKMLPFIASLILLAFTSKKSRAPKAEGIPYDKSKR